MESMDRVLVYRNLLAAEDHIDELLSKAENIVELEELQKLRAFTVYSRDAIMPEEKDSRYHCLAKHYATAYEAAREVYKVSKSDDDLNIMNDIYDNLIDVLSKLWGREINTCERCKKQ